MLTSTEFYGNWRAKVPNILREGANHSASQTPSNSAQFLAMQPFRVSPSERQGIDAQCAPYFTRFVRYYWLDTGKGEGASVSVFKDKAGADESVRLAADYVKRACV
jgi:hypothetical protein